MWWRGGDRLAVVNGSSSALMQYAEQRWNLALSKLALVSSCRCSVAVVEALSSAVLALSLHVAAVVISCHSSRITRQIFGRVFCTQFNNRTFDGGVLSS